MIKIEKTVPLPPTTVETLKSKLYESYFSNMQVATLDIETTGLSPKNSICMLIGLVIPDLEMRNAKVIQFFAEEIEEEAYIIEAAASVLEKFNCILTYNGRSFDISYLKSRSLALGMNEAILRVWENLYNIDLYSMIYNYSTLKEVLPSLSQKSIERFMDIASLRQDEISGGESLDLYEKYLIQRREEQLHQILLHNYDDILQLTRLLPIIHYIDMDRAMYSLGVPTDEFLIQNISISNGELRLTGLQVKNPMDYTSFPDTRFPVTINMNLNKRDFSISLPLERYEDKLFVDFQSLNLNMPTLSGTENGFLTIKDESTIFYYDIITLSKHLLSLVWDKIQG